MPVNKVLFSHPVTIDWYTRTVVDYVREIQSDHSPRVNGKLILRSNAHHRENGQVLLFNAASLVGLQSLPAYPVSAIPMVSDSVWEGLQATSYARLRGKLYKGSAALGVTLGSYKQSRDMVKLRYETLTARADYWSQKLSVLGRKRGRTRSFERDLSGFHLEVIFGWTPLLADIHATTKSVCQLADKHVAVSGTANTYGNSQKRSGPGHERSNETLGYTARVKRTAVVEIVNPNKWLLERAGLLNPASVAWDLVPWSFVVNMFVNTGSWVNSISDFTGLRLSNFSYTKQAFYGYSVTLVNEYAEPSERFLGQSVLCCDSKWRTLENPGIGSLQFRTPEVSWSSAAMAAALFTQKFSVLSRLIPQTKQSPRK